MVLQPRNVLGTAVLIAGIAGLTLPLDAGARTKIHGPLSFTQSHSLRSQRVQARYDEDMLQLRTKSQALSKEALIGQLRAGDILLVRTTSLPGSIAARAAEVPGQFSHLILIAEDPETHELKTLQSDQNKGVHVGKVEAASFVEYVRMGIFRYQQPTVAKTAAARLLSLIESRFRSGPIRYDNKMDLEDSSAIYCTEIATWAFNTVGVQVPARLSRVAFLNPALREELGIGTDAIFTPQDLEVDPRFSLVKEWRDLDHLQETYQADAIFGKYFEWLANGTEELHPGVVNKIAVAVVGSMFAGKIAGQIGEDPSDTKRVTQLMKYSLSMYATVSTYESALQKELRFVDTHLYKESDYEALLDQLKRANRLQGQPDPADDVYYGR